MPSDQELAGKYRPLGHLGPCCDSCIGEMLDYEEGITDHDHDMHPLCCCRDKRSYDEAQEEYDKWLQVTNINT